MLLKFLALTIQMIFFTAHCSIDVKENHQQKLSVLDKLLEANGGNNNNRAVNCGNNYDSENCLIEGTFGNLASNESIDVLVNCHDASASSYRYNQFSQFNSVIWNGCHTMRNLKFLGLRKIQASNRNQVRLLRIENFAASTIESGTFEGFIRLEVLTIEFNYIKTLSTSCFAGLESLLELRLISNDLKWISARVLAALPKLNNLEIIDANLLMANRQFADEKIVAHVSLKIYHIEMDLVEHLFHHVRNLSISLTSSNIVAGMDYCELSRLNGYEKAWIVEDLKLENHRCGFVMENVDALRTLELKRVILNPISAQNDFKLRNLQNLSVIALNHNELTEVKQSMFEGVFEEVEVLNFSHNSLAEIDMTIFKLFPKLKLIDLSYNLIRKLNAKFMPSEVKIIVNFNRFDCQWVTHNSAVASKHFIYTKELGALNVGGLECAFNNLYQEENFVPCNFPGDETKAENKLSNEWNELYRENFIIQPKILVSIVCGSIMLGSAITYILLYAYSRRRLLKQQPFYHMLRESLSVAARDFKGVVWRNLPPTNYEQPISDSNLNVLNMTAEMDAGNIYEEIPAQRV
jgi:Leucine-rich repeat (LRR) protein